MFNWRFWTWGRKPVVPGDDWPPEAVAQANAASLGNWVNGTPCEGTAHPPDCGCPHCSVHIGLMKKMNSKYCKGEDAFGIGGDDIQFITPSPMSELLAEQPNGGKMAWFEGKSIEIPTIHHAYCRCPHCANKPKSDIDGGVIMWGNIGPCQCPHCTEQRESYDEKEASFCAGLIRGLSYGMVDAVMVKDTAHIPFADLPPITD